MLQPHKRGTVLRQLSRCVASAACQARATASQPHTPSPCPPAPCAQCSPTAQARQVARAVCSPCPAPPAPPRGRRAGWWTAHPAGPWQTRAPRLPGTPAGLPPGSKRGRAGAGAEAGPIPVRSARSQPSTSSRNAPAAIASGLGGAPAPNTPDQKACLAAAGVPEHNDWGAVALGLLLWRQG